MRPLIGLSEDWVFSNSVLGRLNYFYKRRSRAEPWLGSVGHACPISWHELFLLAVTLGATGPFRDPQQEQKLPWMHSKSLWGLELKPTTLTERRDPEG